MRAIQRALTKGVNRWVQVAHEFSIRPHPLEKWKDNKNSEDARTERSKPFFVVLKGLKVNREDCAKVLDFVREKEVRLQQEQRSRQARNKTPEKQQEEDEVENKEDEAEPGWTAVKSKKRNSGSNKGTRGSHRGAGGNERRR